MKRISLVILCFVVATTLWADDFLIFNSNVKYRIESLYFLNSSVAPGSGHRVNTPVCVERNAITYKSADCYWYFQHQGNGKYCIVNASTKKYISWDDSYTNSPTITRQMYLSDKDEGEVSHWYIKLNKNQYGETFYFQNVAMPDYCFNVRTGQYVVGTYYKGGSVPSGANELFYIFDPDDQPYKAYYGTVDPPVDPVDPPVEPLDSIEPEQKPAIDSTKALVPISGDILHVYRADGKMDAIPMAYITNREDLKDSLKITAINGKVYSYAAYEIDSVTTVPPASFPHFNSFKFNNKYNRHIIEDAAGTFYGDTLITATVVGIGKTLRPSFKLDDNVQAWIDDEVQESKYTNHRFSFPVTYTIARRGYRILRQTLSGEYVERPYGSETRVEVDFATDHSTAAYGVPTVYVTTNNGTSITSKNYYWDARIKIDGGGVFPDMDWTPMQIKGRGNTSWTSSGKAPYHFKFEEGQKPLGLTKGKHWNLIANRQKYSMTTNAIAQKMAQLVEAAASNHEIPVDLYINGEYRGSYNLTEKIGFSNNSVDLDDETYATLLEFDSYYDEPNHKFRDKYYNLPVNVKEPDFKEGTTGLTTALIENSVNRMTQALSNGEDMSYFIDLDYLARFFFVDEFTANFELNHPKSTFLYNPNLMDSDGRYIFGPCWDFDWAYGYAGSAGYFDKHSTIDYWERPDGAGQVWSHKQRYCGENFDKIYYNLWYDFVNNGKLQELIDFCDDYYRFTAHSFTHDNVKWNTGDAKAYATITEKSKKWLEERAHYVVDYMTNTLDYGSKNYVRASNYHPNGDVNGDGRVTTADVVCVFNYMLNLPNEDFSFQSADTDKNDIITIADLIKVRNLIGTSYKSGTFYGLPRAEATITTGAVSKTPTGVSIPLTVEVEENDYSGIQFDLKIPAGMTIEDLDVSASIPDFDVYIAELDPDDYYDKTIDRYRVSIYSSAANKIPRGQSNLTLQLGWGGATNTESLLNATFADVMFVSSLGEDERSESRSAQFTATDLTGIQSAIAFTQQDNQLAVTASESATMAVYTLDGRIFRMYSFEAGCHNITLPSGIYIINKQKVAIP